MYTRYDIDIYCIIFDIHIICIPVQVNRSIWLVPIYLWCKYIIVKTFAKPQINENTEIVRNKPISMDINL